MFITQRNTTLTFIGLLIFVDFLNLLNDVFNLKNIQFVYIDLLTLFIFAILLWVSWRGWPHTGKVMVVFIVVMVLFTTKEPYISQQLGITLFIPVAIAMVLTDPRWIIFSAVATLLGLLWQAGWRGIYTDLFILLIYGLTITSSVIAVQIANNATRRAQHAQQTAEQAALALQAANNTLEQRVVERTAEVQANLLEIQAQADQQKHLLNEIEQQRLVIRDLSVPIIPINNTTLVMPLVGELDTDRLRYIYTQALQTLQHSRARILVIDVTGVPIVDTQIAHGLIRVSQAARLLGSRVVLVGIRPEVAQTIVGLGLNLADIATSSNLQSALAFA